jgi:hypothetical protein
MLLKQKSNINEFKVNMHADEGFLIGIVKVKYSDNCKLVEKWAGSSARNTRNPGQLERGDGGC